MKMYTVQYEGGIIIDYTGYNLTDIITEASARAHKFIIMCRDEVVYAQNLQKKA